MVGPGRYVDVRVVYVFFVVIDVIWSVCLEFTALIRVVFVRRPRSSAASARRTLVSHRPTPPPHRVTTWHQTGSGQRRLELAVVGVLFGGGPGWTALAIRAGRMLVAGELQVPVTGAGRLRTVEQAQRRHHLRYSSYVEVRRRHDEVDLLLMPTEGGL